MLILSKNALKIFGVVALASCSVFAYSGLQSNMFSNVQAPQVQVVTKAIQVESISSDYAKAHLDLMKKPDEILVSSF